jgi:glutathione S-transferase
MDLYFQPLACSMASRIALYEAGLDASYVAVDRKTGRAGEANFQDINPMAKVPVLRTDDGALLSENVAVLTYIADLAPEAGLDGGDRHQMLRWLSFTATELHKAIFFPLLTDGTPEEVKAYCRGLVERPFATLTAHLRGRETLLEGFSVADAYLATVLNWARLTRLVELESWPVLTAYLDRLLQRPSLARAQAQEFALYQKEKASRAA